MRYPIAIEISSQTTACGVVVPDLPGCFSAGDTLDEAVPRRRRRLRGGSTQRLMPEARFLRLPRSRRCVLVRSMQGGHSASSPWAPPRRIYGDIDRVAQALRSAARHRLPCHLHPCFG